LSGATLTSNGVTNMFRFWMGIDGFGKFIQQQTQVEDAS
jgi:Na+-transporting NADH:ubiquinone oxidoreductase subunit C